MDVRHRARQLLRLAEVCKQHLFQPPLFDTHQNIRWLDIAMDEKQRGEKGQRREEAAAGNQLCVQGEPPPIRP